MHTQHDHAITDHPIIDPPSQTNAAKRLSPKAPELPEPHVLRLALQPDLKSSLGALTGENLRQAERDRLKISRARKKPAGAPSGISRARPSGNAIVGPKPRYGQDDLASR